MNLCNRSFCVLTFSFPHSNKYLFFGGRLIEIFVNRAQYTICTVFISLLKSLFTEAYLYFVKIYGEFCQLLNDPIFLRKYFSPFQFRHLLRLTQRSSGQQLQHEVIQLEEVKKIFL